MAKLSKRLPPPKRYYTRSNKYNSLRGLGRWLEHISQFQSYTNAAIEDREIPSHLTIFADETYRASPPRSDCSRQPSAVAPKHLYILDVDDLLEFSEADILAAWDYRLQTCGSKEAAAELYALYRVLTGADELYSGFTAYLEHPDVIAIFEVTATPAEENQSDENVETKTEESPDEENEETASSDDSDSLLSLTLSDVRELSLEELKSAWANRPDSFASLEAAAETLMILRSVTSEDYAPTNYRSLLGHALIREFEDLLPLEEEVISKPSPVVELKSLHEDRRVVRTQSVVVRTGQADFRTAMMARYGGQCVVTGCQIDTLLEAAHIIPYRGNHSDDELNGLLLRVDIHRLFDAHLLSINPESFTLELSTSLIDETYQALEGKRLFVFSPKPRKLYLSAHYQQFKAGSPKAIRRDSKG